MGGIVDLVKAGRTDTAMCLADWRRLLNDEYGKFEPFFEAAVGEVTGSYPGPDGIVRYDVRQHGKIWFGTHQDGSPDTADSPWLRLSREDVLLWRLNAEGRQTAEKIVSAQQTDNAVPSGTDQPPEMSPDERLNSGLHLLMLFAQAYYKMLESAVGGSCGAVDTELNHYYLWTIKNLRQLLNKHPDLNDFNEKFEPYLPDLYPSTTRDVEWDDMAAPEAERFLSAVQSYVMDKGIHDPAEGSAAQVFIELYRSGVVKALEVAEAYRKRMKEHLGKLLAQTAARAASPVPPAASVSAKGAGMPNLSGIFGDSRDYEREEAQEAAWSIVHRSDPTFVPRTLLVNDDPFLVELGPRMTRVFNMYLDPDEFLEICADYGQLMDVEYVGETKTLVLRLHCEPAPLPFPERVILDTIPERWENECGEYGRVEFDSGHYLPARGYRFKDTTAADRSLICANRFGPGSRKQVASGVPDERRAYYVVNDRFRIEGDFSKVTALQTKEPVWRLQPFTRMVIKVLILDCNRGGLTSDEIYDRAKAAFETEHPESLTREKGQEMIPKRASPIQFLRVQRDGQKRSHPLYDELLISGQKPAVYSFDGKVVQCEED